MYNYSTSTGEKFTFPDSLDDITLQTYIDYVQLTEPTKPKELAEIERLSQEMNDAEGEQEIAKAQDEFDAATAAITDKIMYKKIYPFYARVVAHFADGLTEEVILGGKKQGDGMNLGNLTYLYHNIVKMLNNPPEPVYSPAIVDKDGETWYLPQRYMEKAKLIEFAEASQFEENMQNLKEGNWLALPKIMCVLVRKGGELYSDKLLKREQMFLGWSLQKCLQVAFFLLKRSETSLLNLKVYTAAQDLTRLKQESNN
jgi:hypothetical protein